MCAYACFAGTFPQHHAGTAATTRNLLGLWPQPSACKLRAATGHPESSSLRLSFQPSHSTSPPTTRLLLLLLKLNRASLTTRTHQPGGPGERRAGGSAGRARSPVRAGPALTCRPRDLGHRRWCPVLAEDEFEVELVVGATVCSSHRRGPGCCGSSSGGRGGSSAPLHAGPRRPGGRRSAANFPGGAREARSSVPTWKAGRVPRRTRSRRRQSRVPNSHGRQNQGSPPPLPQSPPLPPPPPARSRARQRAQPRPAPRRAPLRRGGP